MSLLEQDTEDLQETRWCNEGSEEQRERRIGSGCRTPTHDIASPPGLRECPYFMSQRFRCLVRLGGCHDKKELLHNCRPFGVGTQFGVRGPGQHLGLAQGEEQAFEIDGVSCDSTFAASHGDRNLQVRRSHHSIMSIRNGTHCFCISVFGAAWHMTQLAELWNTTLCARRKVQKCGLHVYRSGWIRMKYTNQIE